MFIDKYREVIKDNALNIPKRLRAIDAGYFVVFNHRTEEYEVHHKGQIGGTLALNIPYDELDQRTIDLVLRTSVENAKEYIEEIEKANAKLETDAKKKSDGITEDVITDIHKYVTRHESKDTIDSDIFI